jgi:competence protein ComEC
MSSARPRDPTRLWLAAHPSAWLIAAALSLLGGQFFAAQVVNPLYYLPTIFLLPLVCALMRILRGLFLPVTLTVFFFYIGYSRHAAVIRPTFSADHVRAVVITDRSTYLEGSLRAEPESVGDRARWIVRAHRIWTPTGARETTGEVLITIGSPRREWRYGDRIRFSFRPNIPRDFGNPGGFDYASYLARRRIYVAGFLPTDAEVELLGRESKGFWGAVEGLRRNLRAAIERRFSPTGRGLMKALVIGDMGEIDKDTRALFTAAGVNHVLSISGLHVGMLGLAVFLLTRAIGSLSAAVILRWNLIKLATTGSFVMVCCYTLLAGAMVPTVRSAIMIGVYELAVLLDREEEVFSSLALAALWVGLIWPGVVMDISFQISFLAVLFIVWGMHRIEEVWPGKKERSLPRERARWVGWLRIAVFYLAVPVLATAGTAPMIAYHFGHLSAVGLISNVLIVPLVGFVIVPLGLAIAFFALTIPVLADLLVWPAESAIEVTHAAVRTFAGLPLSQIPVVTPTFLEIALLYSLAVAALLMRRAKRLALVSLLTVVGLAGNDLIRRYERVNPERLRVTYLSVGHGQASVVELPGGPVLLIDAGGFPAGDFDSGEAIVGPFLRSRRILKVDYLLISQPRIDHYGGAKTIIERFKPREIWFGPKGTDSRRYGELEKAILRANVRRLTLDDGAPCRLVNGAEICFLYPLKNRGRGDSVVTRLTFGRVSFLFASDIEKREEHALIATGKALESTILVVPRHGSSTSSSSEFVGAVKPRLAVFSVGRGNRFDLPRIEVVARYIESGADIVRTDEDGAITVETDGKRARYTTHKSSRKGELDV